MFVADGSTNIEFLMRSGSNWVWQYSAPQGISNGWNYDVTFDLTAENWTRVEWNDQTGSNEFHYNVAPVGLEEMQQIFIKVSGYTNDGVVYFDNMRLLGYYTVHLAYTNGIDSFPRAVAEQSNYTGAASCWMIAQYLHSGGFTQSQTQIYNANTHDPAHNNEITPASCASWMGANVPAGYNFVSRYHTNMVLALRESVYWMDYIPPGGLKTPVYILCGTNWQYKVLRGFQTDKKPYGGGGWGAWLNTNNYTVYGMWLNDPLVSGPLGYHIYATPQEMQDIYLASTSDGKFWIVAEPPEDEDQMQSALEQIEGTSMILAEPEPNPELADHLHELFYGAPDAGRYAGRGGMEGEDEPGGGNLYDSIPYPLRLDDGFLSAFNSASVVDYYLVNSNRSGEFYLAAGGERGPGSTRFILKLATDGSLLQATWAYEPVFYQPLPLETADWAARRQFDEGSTVVLQESQLLALPGGSPFTPFWEFQYDVDGTSVQSIVQADIDLSGDADGDGMTDGEELYAGFDPDSGLSIFSVEGGGIAIQGTNHVDIIWSSASNKPYSVLRSVDLGRAFSVIGSNIVATPPENVFSDRIVEPTVYYRVDVE
jgi:hypothetical protein